MSADAEICRPVLLVEGDGDVTAVPSLIRKIRSAYGLHNVEVCPNPIKCGEIPKLRRAGELEKFATYACNRTDGTSVILVVDCDDDCPVTTSVEFAQRLAPIATNYNKRIGLAFMHKEFETIFLFSLRELAQSYPANGWQLGEQDDTRDWTATRGAKGEINRRMTDYSYKETRDQVKFVSAVNIETLSNKCRSVLHLKRMLEWLISGQERGLVYPQLPPSS